VFLDNGAAGHTRRGSSHGIFFVSAQGGTARSKREGVDIPPRVSSHHVGKIKGPILRGLSARAPYFHNGSAHTLQDAVKFYESRFGLALTPEEESDLVAFPRSPKLTS
jgi:cytochrome c peroxidase